MTRFWQCSPVATRIPSGAMRPGDARMAQDVIGAVGSSIHHGRASASASHPAIACSTSQAWLASIMRNRSSPISSRTIRDPAAVGREVTADLELEVTPARGHAVADTADGPCRRGSRSSRSTWCTPDSRRRSISASRAALVGRRCLEDGERLVGRQGVGDVAERDDRTSSSGDISTRSFHSGLPARFASRSQIALMTAAVARWMTPFSGPDPAKLAVADQRIPEPREIGGDLLQRPAHDQRTEGGDRRDAQFVAAPRRERDRHDPRDRPARRSGGRRTSPSNRAPGSARPNRRACRTWGSGRRSRRRR